MSTRATDEPHVPSDVHHWLSRLESEISSAHGGLSKLSTDITDMRLAVARLEGKAGSLSTGTARWLAGLTMAAVAQVGAALYWGGEVRTLLEATSANAGRSLSLIEDHIRTAGPFRAGVERWQRELDDIKLQMAECMQNRATVSERVTAIERRNLIADQNWARLAARGLLK